MGTMRRPLYHGILLLLLALRLPEVLGLDKEISIYEHVESKSKEREELVGPDAPAQGEGPPSYEEFGDNDDLTDIDLDPGSWVHFLDPVLVQEIIEGEQAVYVDGVRKMVDAFAKGDPSELPEAIRVLQTAADQGHAHAQSTLAYLYGSGTGLERSESKAFLYHHFAAEGGNFQSKMALAYIYTRQQMFEKAVQLYAELAATAMASFFSWKEYSWLEPQRLNSGSEESGSTLRKHRGEEDDDFQFTEFQASKANDGTAMYTLGLFYYFGVRGLTRDHAKALTWFLKAADKDNAKAMELAGEIYARGYGVPRDYNKSREMFEQAVRRKHWSAYNGLGYLYVKGLGVEKKDPIKAIEFFQKAAEFKDIHAYYNLGIMYLKGIGVERNPKEGVHLLTHAWKHNYPKAFYQLAKLYQKGLDERGVAFAKNLPFATALYKMVAERGPWSSLMRLGMDSYLKGQTAKAYLFYSRAAELGYEVAQSNAAWILQKPNDEDACFGRSGFCTEAERYLRSHTLWQHASEQGNEHAALLIGDAYYYGKGTKQDLERAAEAYRRAQEQKNAQAMFNLGYMYEHGLGLPTDLHLAKRYYDLALEQDPKAALPVNIALMGLWLRQHYGGSTLVKMVDSLPKAIPAATEWIGSLSVGDGNATLAALFVCLFTVLYLRQRQRRNLVPEAVAAQAH